MLLQVLMSRVVGRSGVGGQGGCNDVGLICPTPVGIGLTDLSVKGRSPPCPPRFLRGWWEERWYDRGRFKLLTGRHLLYGPFKIFCASWAWNHIQCTMHLLEIIIFSLYHFICQAYQDYHQSPQKLGIFLENKVFWKSKIQKQLIIKFFLF